MYLVEVYVTNASLNVNYPFTYYSENEIKKYVRVSVRFNKSLTNAIVSDCYITNKSLDEINKENGFKIQPIIKVIDEEPIISQEQFNLAFWLSKTTVSPLISCLNSMLPKTLKTSKTTSGPKMVRKIRNEFEKRNYQRSTK